MTDGSAAQSEPEQPITWDESGRVVPLTEVEAERLKSHTAEAPGTPHPTQDIRYIKRSPGQRFTRFFNELIGQDGWFRNIYGVAESMGPGILLVLAIFALLMILVKYVANLF